MAKITKSQLIKLQKKLKTDAAIGEQYGITRQAVHQLRKKYGIESVIAKNSERNEKIVEAYEKGESGTDLAKKNNLSISQTYRIINEASKGGAKAKPKKAAKKTTTKKKAAKKTTKKKAAPKKTAKKKAAPKKAAKKAAPKKTAKKKVTKKKAAPKKAAPKKAAKKTAAKKTTKKAARKSAPKRAAKKTTKKKATKKKAGRKRR